MQPSVQTFYSSFIIYFFIIQLQNCVGSTSNLKSFWEKQS